MAERTESPTPNSTAPDNVLTTKIDPTSARFEANMRFLADLMSQVRNEGEKICEGGGAKAIESQHAKGRLTARERIALLADPGTFFELGLYTAHGMYEEWGGAPAAGVVTGIARVETRMVMIIANDATVKAGAFFPMTSKKVIRAQNIAIENHIPTIYLVDSAGVFLPLQEDVFPRYRRFRPRLPQQCCDVSHGHSADRGHHGDVRGGRRLPPGDVRSRADDRRQRVVSRGSSAGAGGNRSESFGGGVGRRGDALGHQRHGRLPRTERSGVHCAHSLDCREVGIPAAFSLGPEEAGRTGTRPRKRFTESMIRLRRGLTT